MKTEKRIKKNRYSGLRTLVLQLIALISFLAILYQANLVLSKTFEERYKPICESHNLSYDGGLGCYKISSDGMIKKYYIEFIGDDNYLTERK